jgi:CDP-archaeol synthase
MMNRLDPLVCASFLLMAFCLAGVAHAWWLRSRWSLAFQSPLDGGRTFAGKRIFGPNKTCRGFMMMVPATGAAFGLLAGLRGIAPAAWSDGLWPLNFGEYFLLGCWAGFGFMAGELPNSFVKRQCGVTPGMPPVSIIGRFVSGIADRIDSILGAYLALAVAIPIPWLTLACILIVAPGLHLAFSVLLFGLGVKGRAA